MIVIFNAFIIEFFFLTVTIIIRLESQAYTEADRVCSRIGRVVQTGSERTVAYRYFRIITGIAGTCPQVLCGNVNTCFVYLPFLHQLGGEGIAYCYVLQTQVRTVFDDA